MTVGAARGPYAKTAVVQRRILETCAEAFAETGFYGATMKDIAKRSGLSYSGLLHHFQRKEDLLIAVLEFSIKERIAHMADANVLNSAEHPLEALRGQLAEIAHNERRPGLLELHCVMSGEATSADHPAHAYYTGLYDKLQSFYAEVFRALAARGELRSASSPESLALMVLALQNGLQNHWLFHRETVRMEAVLREFLTAIVPALAD